MKTKITVLLLFLLATVTVKSEYIIHPWEGKTVAYFGDSITDPRNKAADSKYWNYLKQWLGITP